MNHQKGQILLITIMLVATVLTVVLAVTFKSSTETQLTKLEEESQKALSAAEAGVEVALQQSIGNTVIIGTGGDILQTSGFTGQATVDFVPDDEFVSPPLQKDQQFTFYLTDDAPSFANPWTGSFDIFFDSESGDPPSLELTLIKTNDSFQRFVIDPKPNLAGGASSLPSTGGSYEMGGFSFAYKTSDPFSIASSKVLIVRTLFASTRVGLRCDGVGCTLPRQGKYVTSEAKSPSGVTKKIQLFQSFPQIPAEFFVTKF